MKISRTALLLLFAALAAAGCDRKASRQDAANSPPTSASSSDPAQGAEPASTENSNADSDSQVVCRFVEDGYGPDGEAAVRAEVVVSNLEVPWGLLFLGDGDMLVSERPGRLRLIRDGKLLEEPVATPNVASIGEGGLLSLEKHPDFDSNRQFYAYGTFREGGELNNRVELWQLDLDADPPAAKKVRTILDDIPAAAIHDGGRVRIGPDGMLYISAGDASNPESAQDPDSLSGKILRLTPDGEVPEDNPFDDSPAYIIGVRNSQGYDWRDDGTMLLVDHGPSGEFGWSGHDEVNVGNAGANLGWPTIYGCQTAEGMRAPSMSWDEAVPPGGATIYTGDAIPQWKGDLIVGTLGSRHLHRFAFAEGSGRIVDHGVYFQGDPPEGYGRLRTVRMGPDGHLYVLTSNCDGRGACPPDRDKILRILPQ